MDGLAHILLAEYAAHSRDLWMNGRLLAIGSTISERPNTLYTAPALTKNETETAPPGP